MCFESFKRDAWREARGEIESHPLVYPGGGTTEGLLGELLAVGWGSAMFCHRDLGPRAAWLGTSSREVMFEALGDPDPFLAMP